MKNILEVLENELKNKEYKTHKSFTGTYKLDKNEEYYYNLGKLSMLKACIFTVKNAIKHNKN